MSIWISRTKIMIIITRRKTPVSYTHLDVYKRQLIDLHPDRNPRIVTGLQPGGDLQGIAFQACQDVYKRQPLFILPLYFPENLLRP